MLCRSEIKRSAIGQDFFHHHPVIAPDESEDDEREGSGARVGFMIQFSLAMQIQNFVGFYSLSIFASQHQSNDIINFVAF